MRLGKDSSRGLGTKRVSLDSIRSIHTRTNKSTHTQTRVHRFFRMSLLFCLTFALVGCARDPEIGQRFRAERDLYEADAAFRNATIRPQLVDEAQWRTLGQDYEAIAARYAMAPGEGDRTQTETEIQVVRARAMFAAAQTYGSLQDSTRVIEIFEQMEQDFAELPEVAAEVALAQAGIAEGRGRLDEAIRRYQWIVDQVEPVQRATTAAGSVLGLPLRIARLRMQEQIRVEQAQNPEPGPVYKDARQYYERKVRENPGTLLEIDARTMLAELSADLGDWRTAVRELRQAEADVLSQEKPERDPSMIRYMVAGSLMRAQAPPDSIEAALESVLTDYPDTEIGYQVLTALSDLSLSRGNPDQAISYLDRIREKHAKNEQAASQALLRKGQILEQDDARWNKALEAFRAVSVEHPITEAALWAPLEIAKHYARVGDDAATQTALKNAEREYRDFVQRYPPGPRSYFARERLVQTLALREEHEQAIEELTKLGEDLARTPRGPGFFLAAAQMAYSAQDTLQAAKILDRAGQLYADADVGKWATGEAERLRGTMSQ